LPRTCTICSHPERAEIDKALVAAEESLRTIADRWAISKTALIRHKADHLPQRLVAAKATAEIADGLEVMDELRRCFERVNLLFDACDRWLRDADDPTRYDIGPRAEELRVTFEEERPGPAGKRSTVRRKATLAELLAEVNDSHRSPVRTVTMVETKHADPRELVLKTAARLQPQIELLARLIGELDERPQMNILVSPEWITVRTAVLETLAPHPEARAAVAGRLLQLEAG
jgi:hypothetical protein